ncbi:MULTISPECIES: nitrilase-related carbon-nitrogen hydrolase [unclassified Sinorhizobium]|uniref:nitrilase-related carbon-nitrogen hydrolase n=1 Tax=unclassified Sinorhizobium TaxID=2613772 RepID=UPI0024C386F8|nr:MULTISPECIES: nitrilase-related carbon-nitrogen hydrolase [unclassified Sinorhizobium]MDK1374070.1 nitrilase-related carbon-nitrogen hydrolase [Sinorhizobium sp. 6-70]MDK1480663.1 nitrilase-related carbon-nitrogen hydrolase [Sinorhizobium sp. 6-117]
MSKLTVAAAQIESAPGDIAANINLHLAAIHDAKSRGADLVVFPELSLTDYLSAPDVNELGRSVRAPDVGTIVDASRQIMISFGLIERGDDGLNYNSQVIAAGGKILHVHRKINIPTYGLLREGEFYTKGSNLTLAELGGQWKAATLICADSWSPALPWLAALNGANLLIQPIGSARGVVDGGFDNPRGWDINLRHTAMTYSLPTVMVNHCGRRASLDFWGGSRILDENGVELARAGDAPALLCAELDLAKVIPARSNLPTVRDSDPVFVHAELGRYLTDGTVAKLYDP